MEIYTDHQAIDIVAATAAAARDGRERAAPVQPHADRELPGVPAAVLHAGPLAGRRSTREADRRDRPDRRDRRDERHLARRRRLEPPPAATGSMTAPALVGRFDRAATVAAGPASLDPVLRSMLITVGAGPASPGRARPFRRRERRPEA